ncbi:hypothetical protein FFX78_00585 [Staphylococcus aureus]|nr:hypothetical protein FFX78_00585 [Staphylococcus aureus]
MRLTVVVLAVLVLVLATSSSTLARSICRRGCTKEYRPICGSDWRTYNNPCLFRYAQCRNPGLSFVKAGPCA